MQVRFLQKRQIFVFEMIGLLITLPSSIEWEDYQKELDEVECGRSEMNFKVPSLPKKIKVGDRCYLCWRGNIVGWMTISSIGEKSFVCGTTGKPYSGKFVSRSGKFHKIEPVKCKGFQGFRYIDYQGDAISLE